LENVLPLGKENFYTFAGVSSYDNPKGNTDTERMIRMIKEEVIWLREFTSLTQAYVHSALDYLIPCSA